MNKLFKNLLRIIITFIIFSGCDKDVTVSPKHIWELEKSSIFINSKPNDAEIIINGKTTGLRTPDTIKWLSSGEHEVTLKSYLFQDFSFSINANENFTNSYFHNYFEYPYNFATLNITSIPNSATLHFDDSLYHEKTPHTIKTIFPGYHKIKLEYPEHRADSLELFLRGGTDRTLKMALTDTSIWVNYNKSNSEYTYTKVNDIAFYNNLVWIATTDNGVITFDKKNFQVFNTTNSDLIFDTVNKIIKGPNGKLWICTHRGLTIIDGNIWNSYSTFNTDLPSNFISDIDFDYEGNAWICTQNGLVVYDGINFVTFNASNSNIPTGFLNTIAIDHNNTKWLGTNGMGIIKYDNENWQIFTKDSHGLPGNSINAITIDNVGNVWFGVRQIGKPKFERGGLLRYDHVTWKTINLGLEYRNTTEFYNDNDGTFWIGLASGLIHFKSDEDFILYNVKNSGLIRNEVTAIIKDDQNNLWVGAFNGGITKYKIWNQ